MKDGLIPLAHECLGFRNKLRFSLKDHVRPSCRLRTLHLEKSWSLFFSFCSSHIVWERGETPSHKLTGKDDYNLEVNVLKVMCFTTKL